jgi:hypothetical protein
MDAGAARDGLPRALEQLGEARMNHHGDRLDQLRRLLDQLERLPASADRDRMLAEVRGRAVDVETGIAPTPMRPPPHDELEAEIAAERAPRPAPVRTRRRKPYRNPPRARPVELPVRTAPVATHERRREEVVDLLGQGGVMCLDDELAATTGASRGWSGGLRG